MKPEKDPRENVNLSSYRGACLLAEKLNGIWARRGVDARFAARRVGREIWGVAQEEGKNVLSAYRGPLQDEGLK